MAERVQFPWPKISWVGLFAVAMAYLEAAVVVYLRELYYPEGFTFPLEPFPTPVIWVEIGREAATMIMLAAIGLIAGARFWERLAYFLLSFGTWDIFYYVWLKVLLDWPSSLLEWDVLFLIPVPWAGPVLAPVLVSLAMIGAALVILHRQAKGVLRRTQALQWLLEILAALIIIASFVWDYPRLLQGLAPERFRWEVFLLGLLLGVAVFSQWAFRPSKGRLEGKIWPGAKGEWLTR